MRWIDWLQETMMSSLSVKTKFNGTQERWL